METKNNIVMFIILLDRLFTKLDGITVIEEEVYVEGKDYTKVYIGYDDSMYLLSPLEIMKNELMQIHNEFNPLKGRLFLKDSEFDFPISIIKKLIPTIPLKYKGHQAKLVILDETMVLDTVLMFTSMFVRDVRTTVEVIELIKNFFMFMMMIHDKYSLVYKPRYIEFVANQKGVYVQDGEHEDGSELELTVVDDFEKLFEVDSSIKLDKVYELYQALVTVQERIYEEEDITTNRYVYINSTKKVNLCELGW